MKIEQRILNARSKETNINLIEKLGKIQFLRFVYSAKTGEKTTSNVGEQHIIPSFAEMQNENGQATKGAGRMPWHQRPKKDAVSCEKLRGVASTHRSAGVRMEQSGRGNILSPYGEYIAVRGEPPELKHLSRARKRNQTRFRE